MSTKKTSMKSRILAAINGGFWLYKDHGTFSVGSGSGSATKWHAKHIKSKSEARDVMVQAFEASLS